MNKTTNSERGQVLVIVALAMIGLIGITGLAVDGSMVLMDRRHAQNAADTAVLAAALTYTRTCEASGCDTAAEIEAAKAAMQVDALDRAVSNGYEGDLIHSDVAIHTCDDADAICDTPYAGEGEYIQVVIDSYLDTLFARIIGIPELHNRVQATSMAKVGYKGELYGGASIVGLAPDECKTIWFSGSSGLEISGGDVFSNSSLDCGVTFQGSSDTTLHDGAVDMVASNYTQNGHPDMSIAGGIHGGAGQYPYPPPEEMLPHPACSGAASKSGHSMSPGNWSGTFPPSGVDTLNPGTYCVNGDFRLNAHDELTGNGVTIFMQSGGITWNGGAEINLSAPSSGDLTGLLIYAPMTNTSTMSFNGNGSSQLRGLIFTPAADIIYNGTSDVLPSYVQIVGYTVELTGSNGTIIQYQDPDNWDTNLPSQIGIAQ